MFKLFDFDLEVKPMLEVLVGKTIEQSLLEVMEEEELANLRARQYAYEEIRNVELAEVQRLEEQERRHREEKVQLAVCLSDCLGLLLPLSFPCWTHPLRTILKTALSLLATSYIMSKFTYSIL